MPLQETQMFQLILVAAAPHSLMVQAIQ
jgi:hypothetical protein